MLTIKKRPEPVVIVSANPLALATLIVRLKNGQKELVEWTSVRRVRWTSNKRSYIRHILDPILQEHIGPQEWLSRTMKVTGLGLGLEKYDVGCRLVVDVPVDPLPDEASYDLHVEG